PMLVALHDDGRFGKAREPGSHAVLASETTRVYLAGSSVTADGPSDPSVVLALDVSFTNRAGDRTYVVEVRARDDLGNTQDWQPAGTLAITRPRGGDHRHDGHAR
ncbi:MAG TPA: hypothetical protein VEA38_07205, partial [Terriglobales bacterium]|nr:hypothetical protein [Terriglobales bacterium]